MCGICGHVDDPDGIAVVAMNSLLRHRGPDDEGVYVDPATGVALGARRLSIIDVDGGHQPVRNEDGTVWAVLNGEIYNHRQLQSDLAKRGHKFRSHTDTEVLVHLYEDFGTGFVSALEGMFAFALWDARARRLLIGRDRFGEKPMFFTERGGSLGFASELTALLAGGGHAWELDSEAIDAFFVLGYVPGPESVVAGVRQLPPGSLLTWTAADRSVAIEPYWRPPAIEGGIDEPFDHLVDEAERLMNDAVASRMVSDVPLGVFLSGGVDSTLVASLAARHSPEPIKTFTVGYDVGTVNELGPARDAAKAIGSDHHELILSEAALADEVEATLAAIDQPLADQALVATHAVARFAREQVTVVVGGEGGDEVFGGYPRYRWLGRAHRLGDVLPAALAGGGARALSRVLVDGRQRRLADVLAPKSSLERHLDWVTDGRMGVRRDLYGPRLAPHFGAAKLRDRAQWAATNGVRDVPRRFMLLDQSLWLPDDVLAKADRASMLTSLEVRTPFLHQPLVEFASAIPADVHLRNSGKSLLRAVLERTLPSVGGRRRKTAFRTPTASWLRGPLRGPLQSRLGGSSRLVEDGWLREHAVKSILSAHLAGRRDWTYVLWPMFVLAVWLDQFGP